MGFISGQRPAAGHIALGLAFLDVGRGAGQRAASLNSNGRWRWPGWATLALQAAGVVAGARRGVGPSRAVGGRATAGPGAAGLGWSGRRESNSRSQFGRLGLYH